MKKNYFKLLYIIAFLFIFTSCKKDFLDQVPQVNISDAQYWKSTNDLKLYTNTYYNTMLPAWSDYYQYGQFGLDASGGSDNMVGIPYNINLNGETVVPASDGGWDWGSLRTLNYFLANYNKVNDSWDNIKPYVGETLFFRAMFYFNMLKTFGDLPWINKPLTTTDSVALYSGRLPRNIVADSILQDLDSAIDYLPSRPNASTFRINKETAMLFESRVALYEGTWEKYHSGTDFGVSGQDGTKYLEKAASTAENLLNNPGGYQLDNVGMENGYWALFNQVDYSGSKEVMLWRKFDNNLGLSNRWYLFVPIALQLGITKSLVDDYLCTDGEPIAVSPLYKGDDSLSSQISNRDPRLRQTIFSPGDVITTNRAAGLGDVIFEYPDLANSANPPTGYELYKGNNTDANQQVENSTQGEIYFRFAEAMLNFAEAKAELGTITQDDVDKSINLLRDRVGMIHLTIADIKTDPNWEFPELSPIINEVRRERRIELACEGFRHDDIYRWAAAGKLIVNWKPKGAKLKQWLTLFPTEVLNKYPVDANGYIEPFLNISSMASGYKFNLNRDYLSPLPSDQLVLNPKLVQNPGW